MSDLTAEQKLLIEADSICSLILHRESRGLSEQTKQELDDLVRKLRPITNELNKWVSGG